MLTFYYHPLACSLGGQIALLEAGVAHEQVKVDLAGNRTEFRKINPLGTVPVLQTDSGVLTETAAIMSWLALSYPEARLLPRDAFGFARGLSFLTWLSATAHIARRQTKFPARFTVNAAGHADVQQSGATQFMGCLQRIDDLLTVKRFVLDGDHPSACDHQLMAYANWCALDGISIAHLANFESWRQQMLERPAVQQVLAAIGSPLAR